MNLIHCCPPELPAHIFRNLSPLTEGGRALLDPEDGWIVAYGAFKDDGGSYRSSADEEVSWSLRLLSSLYRATVGPPDAEQFDKTYIKATHASLGLRTIRSITDVAEQWGFVEDCRKEMPKGNMFVVWRVRSNR